MTLNKYRITAGAILAIVLAWRILSVGLNELLETDLAEKPIVSMAGSASAANRESEARKRILSTPTDGRPFLALAQALDDQQKGVEAKAAFEQALRLDPVHPRILLAAAQYFLRNGDIDRGLGLLKKRADLFPDYTDNWQAILSEVETGRGRKFFIANALDNPRWWPEFFKWACSTATESAALEEVYVARAEARLVSDAERACLIARVQNEGHWAKAHDLWGAGLRGAEADKPNFVFNGGFERPILNYGFDWITRNREGMAVEVQPVPGARGSRALRVRFASKRYSEPPIYQYLTLRPGRYVLTGVGRVDALESWLGLQWALYCVDETRKEQRQLARTQPFTGNLIWTDFRQEFAVVPACEVQMLRLELANPQRDAAVPANTAARLQGSLAFDDIAIHVLN